MRVSSDFVISKVRIISTEIKDSGIAISGTIIISFWGGGEGGSGGFLIKRNQYQKVEIAAKIAKITKKIINQAQNFSPREGF